MYWRLFIGLYLVSASRRHIDELLNRSDIMDSRKGKLRQLGSDIGQSILELKKLIKQARAQAASVSMAAILKCIVFLMFKNNI